jgi:hypothetical protein
MNKLSQLTPTVEEPVMQDEGAARVGRWCAGDSNQVGGPGLHRVCEGSWLRVCGEGCADSSSEVGVQEAGSVRVWARTIDTVGWLRQQRE